MSRNKSMLVLLAVTAVGAALAIGLVWATRSESAEPYHAPIKSNYSVEKAKSFARFPIYYAGDSVNGYPLTAVFREQHADAGEVVSFLYGYSTCDVKADNGCTPTPIEVQVWPACFRNPSLYRQDMTFSPRGAETTVRGVPAASYEGGNRLEVQTGKSTVVIFAESPESVVPALRGINNNVPPKVALPPPTAGAMTGELSCS